MADFKAMIEAYKDDNTKFAIKQAAIEYLSYLNIILTGKEQASVSEAAGSIQKLGAKLYFHTSAVFSKEEQKTFEEAINQCSNVAKQIAKKRLESGTLTPPPPIPSSVSDLQARLDALKSIKTFGARRKTRRRKTRRKYKYTR